MKNQLPNFLTCCNLISGVVGIIYIFEGDLSTFAVAYFVWIACVFDFFDGFAARALKVTSPIGKELDSLADMVSFGLLPALFMYKLIGFQVAADPELPGWLPYVAVLIAVCSALRLAIFNIDETQSDSFRGLPTPSNALFITALPFLFDFSAWILAAITIVFSLLMVSRIELFALKFKDLTWSANKVRFTFLIASVLLLVAFRQASIPLIIILYVLLSLTGRTFA